MLRVPTDGTADVSNHVRAGRQPRARPRAVEFADTCMEVPMAKKSRKKKARKKSAANHGKRPNS
ncbi:hypothetical protein GCM10009681_51400 [Luedemannella helvata]|uniref:Uncharacterized protein n=1 Tax=Luedemannella helvata TaxID=349315 RepID=A0ABN2L374_9ACTN